MSEVSIQLMAQLLKSWESPRKEGRNNKGKGGSARQRQIKKRNQMMRQKLKDQGNNSQGSNKKGENHDSLLFLCSQLSNLNCYIQLQRLKPQLVKQSPPTRTKYISPPKHSSYIKLQRLKPQLVKQSPPTRTKYISPRRRSIGSNLSYLAFSKKHQMLLR
jgi:hypothetical protein